MTVRDISKVEGRIRHWKNQLQEQMKLKKDQRDTRVIDQAKLRIQVLSSWLKPVSHFAKPEIKEIPKEVFKKSVSAILGADLSNPAAVMVIPDKKTLDAVYEKIKMANIQVQAPPEVLRYFRDKLKAERPYKQ